MEKPKLIRITTIPASLYKLLRGQLAFMSEHYQVIGITSSGRYFEDITHQEGVPVLAVEMSRSISPIADLKALWRLMKIFRRERPQIVHTHTPKAGLLGMIAAKLTGVPVRLHTIAGLPIVEAHGMKRTMLVITERITSYCATRIYLNSFGLHQFMIDEKLAPPAKMKLLGNGSSNGIDTHYFDPAHITVQDTEALRTQLGIAKDDFVYCFIGRMVRDKGVNELITAFEQIAIDHSNVKLLLVGNVDGGLDPLYPATIQTIKTHSCVISTGIVQDVRPYLTLSDLFVFPSYREGFPNVVLQAGAMGIPCVVSNINGCNEIITSGLNGLIVPVKEADALQTSMLALYNDKEQRQSLASHARQEIVRRYQREYLWECLLKEYKQFTDTLPC